MILHIINKAPDQSASLIRCLDCLAPDDSLVLIEDGVYLLTWPPAKIESLAKTNIYYLQSDVKARGLADLTVQTATPIDYSELVELVCSHSKSVSWF